MYVLFIEHILYFHHVLQFVPQLFQSATYPITSLLQHFWKTYKPHLKDNYIVDPPVLEMVAMLERALNYAHTGNAKVLTKKLMDRSWLSLSVIKDGMPCISHHFISSGSMSTSLITVKSDKWPVDSVVHCPLTASRRTQLLTWGESHYQVCACCLSYKLHILVLNHRLPAHFDVSLKCANDILVHVHLLFVAICGTDIAHLYVPMKCADIGVYFNGFKCIF